jgi:hypothetical protein
MQHQHTRTNTKPPIPTDQQHHHSLLPNTIPAEIHKHLVIKRNKCLESLMQNPITGISWHQAQNKLRVCPESKFAKALPKLTTISAIELMGKIIKKTNNPIHSISKVGNEVVLNFYIQTRPSAAEFIGGFKSHTLATVFLPEDYNTLFPSTASLTLEPLSYRGSTSPNVPWSKRTTAASVKQADHIRSIAEQEPYTMPADIPQPHLAPKIKTGTISYVSATNGHHRRSHHTTQTPSTPQIG